MEKFSEREMQRQLRHFEEVWRRVGVLRSPRETAERCGVIWQNGEAFFWPDTIRMNLALPKSRLVEAMGRLEKYVFI